MTIRSLWSGRESRIFTMLFMYTSTLRDIPPRWLSHAEFSPGVRLPGTPIFLAAGDSDYPIELLKGAGVDMSTPEVVDSAMKTFRELIGQLEELVEND